MELEKEKEIVESDHENDKTGGPMDYCYGEIGLSDEDYERMYEERASYVSDLSINDPVEKWTYGFLKVNLVQRRERFLAKRNLDNQIICLRPLFKGKKSILENRCASLSNWFIKVINYNINLNNLYEIDHFISLFAWRAIYNSEDNCHNKCGPCECFDFRWPFHDAPIGKKYTNWFISKYIAVEQRRAYFNNGVKFVQNLANYDEYGCKCGCFFYLLKARDVHGFLYYCTGTREMFKKRFPKPEKNIISIENSLDQLNQSENNIPFHLSYNS
jgi:hypothetical protein